jgi:hypothetical protein
MVGPLAGPPVSKAAAAKITIYFNALGALSNYNHRILLYFIQL